MQNLKRHLAALRSDKETSIVILLVLAAITGIIVLARPHFHTAPHIAPENRVVTESTDTPDETKPGPSYNWVGKPEDPKKIKVPSVGIDAYLQKVGVDQSKNMAVPTNVHIGGWFVDSVRPGQKGLSIIDGHYDGRVQSDAIFKNLAKVKTGQEFTIEFGDGSIKTFRVTTVTTTTIQDAAAVLFNQDPKISSQLNLITCGGKYDRQGHTYDHRVIVSAQLVE